MIFTSRYKSYVIGTLALVYTFNFLDRQVLGLLMESIKVDLGLSDTQLGLLTGIAFAFFYSVLGIPIARWADRGNRVAIISLSIALWSAMVALCGMVTSFVQLLLVRIGAGVGEAGCVPPAHSLIADYFPREERPRAMAVFMMGAPLSVIIGFVAGGWLNEFYGWRSTFLIVGLPGVFLALVVKLTLREPRHARAGKIEKKIKNKHPTLIQVITIIHTRKTLRSLLLAFVLASSVGYGIGQWVATFFIRSHHMSTGELGTWFALSSGLGSFAGTYLGGHIASHYLMRMEKLQLRIIALTFAIAMFVSMAVYLTPAKYVALFMMFLFSVCSSLFFGPVFALLQELVEEDMRATVVALIFFVCNLVGMGLGPLMVGAASDLLFPLLGSNSLRAALFVTSPGYLLAAYCFWLASHSVERDLVLRQQ